MSAQYDLTSKMIPFLDLHLVFPLLEFLEINELFYTPSTVLEARYELALKTNMIDFIEKLNGELKEASVTPAAIELGKKREEILEQFQNQQAEAQKVMDVIENPDVIAALRQDKLQNLQFLRENYGMTPEMIQTLYKFGQFQYSCGNYGGAADMLYHYRVLSTDDVHGLSALWGKLASEILVGNWEVAFEAVQELKDNIDKTHFPSALHQLEQRTWFLHWSLFVFFNHPKGRDAVIDLFFQPQYINTIQTSCPWILRYLTAAVITNRRRKNLLKDLVKIIEQESYQYRDPVTEFVEALYVNFDFDLAKQKLVECEEVLENDFFLVAVQEDFIQNARCFISETYCRIHQKIDISELSQTLNMSKEEGEKWIVNLIRDTRVDAKIDYQENTVVMNTNPTSVYQQIIEKTKGLSFRSQVLATSIDKREAAQAKAAQQEKTQAAPESA
ncbi:eukaryotic translation initiation factor 3 subunit E [Lunasporangiospora selenospora]|uniref:Eukaryotic translation initiation factor 3 subunit E n=1 Tax=Lunasporangiospora selenospora TaxID=979761 RepID=A0A9P6FXK1_9FUNG|nr:eukaryotic translation initiation factor 3 subunit E [Lunasporangiospora selenospora]